MIILKLDDLRDNAASHQNFRRVLEILTRYDVVATFGVIGESLAGSGKDPYCDFLKTLHASGRVELWNHGYQHNRDAENNTEFRNCSLAEQIATLEKTNALMYQNTGIRMRTFGAPFNHHDGQTEAALLAAGLDVWFFPDQLPTARITALMQRVNMEISTGVVDDGFFLGNLAQAGEGEPMVLQGHPPVWGEADFKAFERIIGLLKSRGMHFVTAVEYADKCIVKQMA